MTNSFKIYLYFGNIFHSPLIDLNTDSKAIQKHKCNMIKGTTGIVHSQRALHNTSIENPKDAHN